MTLPYHLFARAAVATASCGAFARADDAPKERLAPYERSADFPPADVGADDARCARWFSEVFCAAPLPAPDARATDRERALCALSAVEYAAARRAGRVTCEEYARALVARARHLRAMNQWTRRSYELFDRAVDRARALDAKAAREGVEAIAPLYGLCVPMKGTSAVIEVRARAFRAERSPPRNVPLRGTCPL